jgi:RNA ligase (TIGR02306 family)
MSSFAVIVKKLTIKEHPNADALEVAEVDAYQSIVRKGAFKTGDLVAYIPEQSVIPVSILKELNLEGKLAGKDKNRLKPARLRGVLSQGLCYPARSHWSEGDDVTGELGIEKWEPPIPAHLAGEVYNLGSGYTISYDIENFKKYPDIFHPGEQVVMTEKLHGTFMVVGVIPQQEDMIVAVSSKGLFSRGLALKLDSENNKHNLYVRAERHYNISHKLKKVYAATLQPAGMVLAGVEEYVGDPVYVFGEVFGKGVQDLSYGAKTDADNDIGYRVFDIYVGRPGKGRFLNHDELNAACEQLEFDRVPVLYEGPFSKEVLDQYTNGLETVSGKGLHVREGVVVRPVIEQEHLVLPLNRVQLKSVSGDYLTRKGGTEFN